MAILNHGSTIRTADGGQTTTTIVTATNIGSYGVALNSTYYIGTTQNIFNRASGAQTLTGVSIDGNAATASNSTQFGGEANTNFLRGLSSGTEANINNYTDNGFRIVSYTGHSKGLLSFSPGGSIGTVQHEYFYGIPTNGWRVRNKTDSTTWSAWGNVVMTDTNQGALTGTVITTGNSSGLSPTFTNLYANIFYDQNNTAYYIDPASTSNLVGLTVSNTITGNITGSSASASYLTGGDSAFYGILLNNTSAGLNTVNNAGLVSAEYIGSTNNPTGSVANGHFIQISDAGGTDVKTQWYYNNVGCDIYMRLMWGNTNWKSWRKLLHDGNYSGYSTFSGSVTSTYGNFTTPGLIMGDVQYGFYVVSGNVYYKSASGGAHYWRNIANSANVVSFDNSGNILNTGYINASSYIYTATYFQTGGNLIYPSGYGATQRLEVSNSANNNWIDGLTLAPGGIVTAPYEMRSPIFYDSANTAYYLDPASTSNLVGLTVANTITGSITGNAANVTGIVAIANGGTGATSAANARTNLGATTVGSNLFILTNPSAVTFLRVNADNTVSALDAATFRTAIGAGTGGGSVTSVGGTGTVSGLTLTGTVTTTGNLTLGGTLSVLPSNFASQTANTFLAAPNAAAGTPTFRSIVAADIPTLNQNTTGSSGSCTGNAATATNAVNLSTNRTNWSTNGTITAVVGQLSWKNYNNNHTIFDASNATSPDGTAINNTNPSVPWTGTYPTLMGWNGANTYGVRVDISRYADNVSYAPSRTDSTTYPVLWGAGTSYTLAYSCASVYIQSSTGYLYANAFYDAGNTAYYIDPAGTSVLNAFTGSHSGGSVNVTSVNGAYLGVNNTTNTNGYGISLYNGAVAGEPTYGLMFQGTATFGTHGSVTGDWATYFTMNNDNTRGWIFRKTGGGGNIASISGGGILTVAGDVRSTIFYDSNNTAYYVDPASTSNLNGLNVVDANLELYKSQTVDMSNTTTYSTSNYYPVTISVPTEGCIIQIQNNLNSNVPSWATHSGGFTLNLKWRTNGSGWGTTAVRRIIDQYFEQFTNQTICGGITQMNNSSIEVVWLRGGGQYFFKFSRNLSATAQATAYTLNSQTVTPTSTAQNTIWNSWSGGWTLYNNTTISDTQMQSPVYYDYNNTAYYIDAASTSNLLGLTVVNTITGNITGNAGTATILQTARNINGTSFNGSAAITTATWGTARTITIGSTGKSVDGSAAVAWSLAEIGAAATNQTMFIGTTSVAINRASASQTLTGISIDGSSASCTGNSATTTLATKATRANGNFYIDDNYGNTVVGAYNAARYQGVYAMGDSYKLAADGTTTGTLYGIAWSHPNAGGAAGNLSDHGALILINGGYVAAISSSIRCTVDMRTPIYYDSNNTAYYTDPASTSNLLGLTVANTITGSVSGNAVTAGGLAVHSGTNNEVNKIVRTDVNGYILAGWINTISGDNGTTAIDRVYASSDGYIRYYTPANFRTVLDVPTRAGSGASGSWGISVTGSSASCTGNSATATRTSGQSGYPHAGTGMWAFYNWGGNDGGTSAPSATTYTTGLSVGSNPGDQAYGFQIANNMWNTGLWTRNYNSTFGSWIRLLDSSNYVGYSAFTGNVDGTQFRDANDTSFYLDPAGTSNLNKFSTFTMSYNDMNSMHIQSPYVTRYNSGANYRNGTMGWGTVDCNHMFSNWGSGFIDSWTNPANAPGSSSHYVGFQGFHYNHQNNSQAYGFQMLCAGEADNRFFWRSAWPNLRSWVEMIHTGNIGSQTVATAGSCTGNAATATTLQTARTIGGVSFNGSANIDLPGVNTAGNQNTSGNSATATILQTARNINGTSFDGSAAITTATWGTSRNITIGATIKSVDGSANVGWTLAEITGSQAANVFLASPNGTTGNPTFRAIVAADIPTLNQNTTGNAATVTNGMYLSGDQNISGAKYFTSNKGATSTVGANNTYSLEAFSSDAGAAGMSFHRGGYYAVNMGLDPDNVLRIGGWSASANRLQLDMSGNLTVAGAMYGTNFIDSDNTAYFCNPASTSNLLGLTVTNTITGSITGNAGGSSASCTGNAATATTTDNINGRAFYNRDSGNALAQDSYTNNGIGYVTSVSLFGQTDGGMYASAYSTSWIHQIYGDFRTGQIAIRGRNNGTWQSWRFVLDSSNVSSYALPISGGTITGAISTNVSGTSIFIGNQNVSTTNALRINWHADADLNYFIGKRGGAWTQPMDIAFYTGIKYHANSTYNAHIFYVGGFDTTEAFSIGKGDNHVRVNNYLYAPLMYDTNDTAFYCNPGGNSIFNTIKTNNVYGGNASVTAASSTTINTAYNLTELTMAAFITTLTFSNIQSTGTVHMWTIVTLGNGSATSVTWPAAIKWPGGTAPNITGTNTKRDIYQFITYDGGTNIYAIIVGQNL